MYRRRSSPVADVSEISTVTIGEFKGSAVGFGPLADYCTEFGSLLATAPITRGYFWLCPGEALGNRRIFDCIQNENEVVFNEMLPRLPKGYLEQQLYQQAVDKQQSAQEARSSKAGKKLPQALRKTAFKLGVIFRREHGLVTRDVAEQLGRLLQTGITPRRKAGAKPITQTVRAAKLLQSGRLWDEIYPLVWQNYLTWPKHRQQRHAMTLRRNVNRLLKKGLCIYCPSWPSKKATE